MDSNPPMYGVEVSQLPVHVPESTAIYRKLALWHYALGASLVSPKYREKLLEKLGTADPCLGEIAALVQALKTGDGAGVWSAMKAYWIEQEGTETVIDAIIKSLEASTWGTSVSASYNALISAHGKGEEIKGHVDELKALLDKI
jgi:hypothetical protein